MKTFEQPPNLRDIPLDRQIELQILKVDRLDLQLKRCQQNRLTQPDYLLPIYDQLAAAKAELANLQLQEINQLSIGDVQSSHDFCF
ncbi:MAG: hypothetical protein QNJ55_33570 [Xenococcus sp. MO_188.B8]|nr:hypothetical protein [Xenococcus sp. MO_188.B8]